MRAHPTGFSRGDTETRGIALYRDISGNTNKVLALSARVARLNSFFRPGKIHRLMLRLTHSLRVSACPREKCPRTIESLIPVTPTNARQRPGTVTVAKDGSRT